MRQVYIEALLLGELGVTLSWTAIFSLPLSGHASDIAPCFSGTESSQPLCSDRWADHGELELFGHLGSE